MKVRAAKPYIILNAILLALVILIVGLGPMLKTIWNQRTQPLELAKSTLDPTKCMALPERTEEQYTNREGEEQTSVKHPREDCLLRYLNDSKDRRTCELLNVQDHQEYCYELIAKTYSDPNICMQLEGTPHSWKSVAICRATALRDIKECDVLGKVEMEAHLPYSPKTDCILEVVGLTRDYRPCLDITGSAYGGSDAMTARNQCLKIAGCDKPDERKELCALMAYPTSTWPEEKAQCLTETWKCPQ